GLAHRVRDGAADGGGLRPGAALAGGGIAPRGPEGGGGDGQPEHAHAGVAVRGVPAGAGAADRGAVGGPPNAQAWEWAQSGGDRAERPVPAVLGPTHGDGGDAAAGGRGMGGAEERAGRRGAVAFHDGRRSDQTSTPVPVPSIVAVY